MTHLLSIQNAADRAAVTESDFQKLDAALFAGATTGLRFKLRAGKYIPQLQHPNDGSEHANKWRDLMLQVVDGNVSIVVSESSEA